MERCRYDLDYIGTMARELARMARKHGHDTLAYLFVMAEAETKQLEIKADASPNQSALLATVD